mgnify:CR=1 FL=1
MAAKKKGGKKAGKKGGKKAEVEYHSALFAILRQKRKELADEAGVPPYVIFSDRTLTEMSAYYPQSSESLLNISGVGQVKLKKYGDVFLEVIKVYCEKHELKEKPRKSSSPSPVGKDEPLPARSRIVGNQRCSQGSALACGTGYIDQRNSSPSSRPSAGHSFSFAKKTSGPAPYMSEKKPFLLPAGPSLL